MDRIAYLIAKLQDLLEQKSNPETMLVVTQMLENELMQIHAAEKLIEKKKVAVRMPVATVSAGNAYVALESVGNGYVAVENAGNGHVAVEKAGNGHVAVEKAGNGYVAVENAGNGHVAVEKAGNGHVAVESAGNGYLDEVEIPAPDNLWLEHAEYNGSKRTVEVDAPRFDVLQEVPTLSHQPTVVKELNELMAEETPSLNDRLKENTMEVADRLQGVPIRDLRKAINVNDRYRFVMELFRGDEAMFERSLKTINHFSIFPEAQYWIQRELKLKLGWRDDQATVLLFDQLVKRRFL